MENGYTLEGNYSNYLAIMITASPACRFLFGMILSSMVASRKLHKLFPFVQMQKDMALFPFPLNSWKN